MKLKPFPTQASLTSLQFRALKSALAATDSREKVQTIVSSLSIVHDCKVFSFRVLCSIPLAEKKESLQKIRRYLMNKPLMVATGISVSTNTFPRVRLVCIATETG